MNNEPVAWMGKDYDGIKTDFYFDVERNKLPYRLYETAIPLYTHPAKTLTTKEIADVWFSLYKEAIPMMDVVILTTFGEAILRKAQEK